MWNPATCCVGVGVGVGVGALPFDEFADGPAMGRVTDECCKSCDSRCGVEEVLLAGLIRGLEASVATATVAAGLGRLPGRARSTPFSAELLLLTPSEGARLPRECPSRREGLQIGSIVEIKNYSDEMLNVK